MLYSGVIACVVTLTVYFMAMAVIGNFRPGMAIFARRSAVCVVLGSILGIFVSGWFFTMSRTMGYVGMGLSIGTMYVLFFSGIINALIQRIPANIRRGFRIAFNVIRIVLVVVVIIGAIVGLLTYIGV